MQSLEKAGQVTLKRIFQALRFIRHVSLKTENAQQSVICTKRFMPGMT